MRMGGSSFVLSPSDLHVEDTLCLAITYNFSFSISTFHRIQRASDDGVVELPAGTVPSSSMLASDWA